MCGRIVEAAAEIRFVGAGERRGEDGFEWRGGQQLRFLREAGGGLDAPGTEHRAHRVNPLSQAPPPTSGRSTLCSAFREPLGPAFGE